MVCPVLYCRAMPGLEILAAANVKTKLRVIAAAHPEMRPRPKLVWLRRRRMNMEVGDEKVDVLLVVVVLARPCAVTCLRGRADWAECGFHPSLAGARQQRLAVAAPMSEP
jgi:hypothetical protein